MNTQPTSPQIPTGFIESPANAIRKDGKRFFESDSYQIVEKADKTAYITRKDGNGGLDYFEFDNPTNAFSFVLQPTNQNKTMQPQPTQPQIAAIAKIVNYTQNRIDNWYSNAKEEYGVIGSAKVNYNVSTSTFEINGIENGKKTKFSLWNCDGIPRIEYVFDVWMEEFEVVENSQPEPLTVGQTIQGENCRLIVTAVKEAKKANNEVEPTINRLKENISRLEKTIESGAFQKGYIENCKKDIDSYKTQIEKLLSQQAEIQPTQEPENKPTQEPSNEPIKSMTENPATAATYAKYCPNVFVAKCDQQHEKGSIIEIETKYGKIHEVIVFNLIHQKNGFFYYSIVRADGYNVQERAKQKAARYEQSYSVLSAYADSNEVINND